MGWTTLSYAYKEVLSSTKLNLMQDNFAALAAGAAGAPAIQTAAIADNAIVPAKYALGAATIRLTDDFTCSSTSFVGRNGAQITLTLGKTSATIIVFVSSVWTVSAGAGLRGRVNINNTYYTPLGAIAVAAAAQGYFPLGGHFIYGGITGGSAVITFEVAKISGSPNVINQCSTYPEYDSCILSAIEL